MVSAAPLVTQPGVRIGRYELERWLGEGGFAEVWLAKEAGSETSVALKILRRGRARDAQQKVMFLDEALLAARIHHPNVARVLEIGDAEGLLFIAMECVAGGSLQDLLEGAQALGEPVPAGVALRLMADVCAGLHAAHELAIEGRPQHVIHRDISPQNILLTEDGIPKLIDFGIAKARERLSKETSTGITKGKIAYMSPEQARGAELDRRADVWAIAMVTYELLEGRRLIEGPNEVARLQLLVSRPVLPAFDHTPPAARGVLERALAFYPRDRHATAEELRVDLERAIEAGGLVVTAEDVKLCCQRVRAAARPTQEESAPFVTGALLGEGPRHGATEATVSTIQPAMLSGPFAAVRGRGGRVVAGAALVVIIGGAAFFATRHQVPSGAPESAADGPTAAATGTSATAATTAVAAPPAETAAPLAETVPPRAAPPTSTERPALAPTESAGVRPTVAPARPVAAPPRAPATSKKAAKPSDDDQIE